MEEEYIHLVCIRKLKQSGRAHRQIGITFSPACQRNLMSLSAHTAMMLPLFCIPATLVHCVVVKHTLSGVQSKVARFRFAFPVEGKKRLQHSGYLRNGNVQGTVREFSAMGIC